MLILFSVLAAFASSMLAEPSSVDNIILSVSAQDLKPAVCSMTLTNIVRGAGTINGTASNDLIFGSSGVDTIDGLGGDDCILSGNGDDQITGGDDTDVCLGGQGTDTFITCETELQ